MTRKVTAFSQSTRRSIARPSFLRSECIAQTVRVHCAEKQARFVKADIVWHLPLRLPLPLPLALTLPLSLAVALFCAAQLVVPICVC